MLNMRTLFLAVIFYFCSIPFYFSQNRISILDIKNYSGVSDISNIFSLNHALKVSGVPFSTYTSFSKAQINPIIVIPSTVEIGFFSNDLIDSLSNYVSSGGILFLSQLKENKLFNIAGVNSYVYTPLYKNIYGDLDLLKKETYFLNTLEEVNLKICDTSFVSGFNCRGYSLSTAISLANFDDGNSAISKNQFGNGFVYLMGVNWDDVILRNQVAKDFKIAKHYSNDFEIGSDFYSFLLKGIYENNVPFAVSKHTSVSNSNSILVITHDVDATSAISDFMTDFSSFEYENKIRATYFITTHYNHDSIAKDFWNGYEDQIESVKLKGHEIASHSVSHVPDFDNSSIVLLGDCNSITQELYHPFYDGIKSNEVTVCGEISVSKQLLKEAVDVDVISFRAGYLAYNKNLLEGLEFMNYSFNSSNSANDVLTSFPYQGHLSLSMSADTSSILEIPNTISDVFVEERISEENYLNKVEIWKTAQHKYSENYSPTVLLIHPNRSWKIIAEQIFLSKLTEKTTIIPFEEYGFFWKDRVSTDFDFEISDDSTLIIRLKLSEIKLNKQLSFVIKNGRVIKKIKVLDENNKLIPFSESDIRVNEKLIYFSNTSFEYGFFKYDEKLKFSNLEVFPIPSDDFFNFNFKLINDSKVAITIFDELGNKVEEIINSHLELGNHKIKSTKILAKGLYFYSIIFDDQEIKGKVIVK